MLVAAADGTASLLEMRKSGALVSQVACVAPLHCAISDGCMALLGKEDGEVSPPSQSPSCNTVTSKRDNTHACQADNVL